jgi:hypothetical protein
VASSDAQNLSAMSLNTCRNSRLTVKCPHSYVIDHTSESEETMRAYSVEKVVSYNGTVQLEALPFSPGEIVEVIVLARKAPPAMANGLLLKDSVVKYDLPFEPVADEYPC